MYLSISGKISIKNKIDQEKIYLIYQFFVHKDADRNKELRKCLRFNVENPHIDKIYLLNEKIYTNAELGIESAKIEQINIVNRIKFKDIFSFVEQEQLKGYIITCNADIFFDKTVNNLRKSKMSNNKQILTQLRFDYTDKQLGKCKLFGPRADSQDTWIWHSNYNPYKERKMFNIIFGKPGCDNKLTYLFNLIGFDVVNQPYFVKTYHIQKSQERDYNSLQPMPRPYMIVSPFITNRQLTNTKVWGTVGWRLIHDHKTSIENITHNFSRFLLGTDNTTLREHLKISKANDDIFLIPQTDKNGIILASVILMLNNVTQGTFFQTGQITPEYQSNIQVKHFWNIMLNLVRATQLQHTGDLIAFSKAIMESFNRSDICLGYSTWDSTFRELMNENKSDFYKSIFGVLKNKQWVSSTVTNIFNHLHHDPWIKQLNNRKLLIISPNTEEIEQQIKTVKLKNLYGFDIFANCEFSFIKFSTWNTNIQEQIVNKLGDFDIALCEGGVYGPIISNYVYGIGKSAIDIGDMLPLYFGLWTNSDMKSNKDIIQLYLNSNWKKL
jgi:hypothetical protein